MIRWFASLLLLPSLAWAELPPGPFARIVVLRPRDGMQSRFEEGYKRHLEWHRQNNDSWTWLGWTFVLGKRAGWFMDGTFGHAPENFDAAVAPAADAADNAANVFPYAELVTHGVFQYLPALSRGGPQAPTSPFLELTTIELQPGHQSVFEALLNRLAQNRGDSQLLWYKLVAGGSSPTYLLMRPRLSLSQVARATAFLENPDLVEADRKAIASSVGHVEIEVLRYRADLSYIPPGRPNAIASRDHVPRGLYVTEYSRKDPPMEQQQLQSDLHFVRGSLERSETRHSPATIYLLWAAIARDLVDVRGFHQFILLILAWTYFLGGVHLERPMLWVGLLIAAGYVAALFIATYVWTILGVVFAAALALTAFVGGSKRAQLAG